MTPNTISFPKPSSTFGTVRLNKDSTALRDELVHLYLPLVTRVIRQLLVRLPAHADVEELHSIGTLGLLAAIDRYQPQQSETFASYAQTRIRGAILDELRRMDSLPRSRRSQLRNLQKVISKLEQQHGRAPYDSEIAKSLGLTIAELDTLRSRVQPVSLVSLDATLAAASSGDGNEVNFHETIADERIKPAFERIERQEMVQQLGQVLETLPQRQRDVLVMYYYEGLRLIDIARAFGLTEARISQIHTQALGNMRQRFNKKAA